MIELVTRNYWWPRVIKNIGRYMDSCDICQRMKNRTKAPAEKLKLSEIPKKLQTHLTVDFITKLPLVARKNAILVVCDRLSKIIATTEKISAEGLVRLFRNNIWKLYRLPESVVLDRGPQFATELTKKLNRMCYRTKVWTDFGQGQGQLDIDRQIIISLQWRKIT